MDPYLLATPVLVASIVGLLVFVGCGIDSQGRSFTNTVEFTVEFDPSVAGGVPPYVPRIDVQDRTRTFSIPTWSAYDDVPENAGGRYHAPSEFLDLPAQIQCSVWDSGGTVRLQSDVYILEYAGHVDSSVIYIGTPDRRLIISVEPPR